MPKTSTSKNGTRPSKRTNLDAKRGRSRAPRNERPTNASAAPRSDTRCDYPYVVENGRTTYMMVPYDEYVELVKTQMLASVLAQPDDSDREWTDAGDFALELAADRIAAARKAQGLTQKQLGAKLGLPQSQISRIERKPDRTTVRTLKRIAKALNVDVRVFLAAV